MSGPLEGIRVLDFTRYQQGPCATVLLADMGAEVIKVEPRVNGEWGRQTERDETGFSAYFETYNRGKKSVTLDIRTPEGRGVVERLVPRVDALVENFRPGYMNKVGLGYEAVRPLNPRLVYASASAFGSRGPMARRPGYDHIAQAVSGLMVEQSGGPDFDPAPALPGAADEISAMLFAFGIVSALFARERTGEGQHVEASLLGSMLAFQGRQIARFFRTGTQTYARWRRNALYTHYRTADGWVAIAAQDAKRWPALCRTLGRPELTDDPRFAGPWDRHHNAAELRAALDEAFAARTTAEWLSLLIAEDVPCAPVNDYRAILPGEDLAEQAEANGYITTVDHPNIGPLRSTGLPLHLSGTPPARVGYAPELGRHTEEVLLELGFGWDEIEGLKAREVI